ncbi:MAG: YigZ family protein [Bacteroidales bacterium]
MVARDTYKTIAEKCAGVYREKASKFIALAYPVTTEDEVKEILKSVKKEYFDANHHCYAYFLGHDKDISRMNDDGEPSGTAGRPILGQIQSFDLTNTLVIVIRYFGGTKLGVSGLINAYKTSAREALSQASVLEKTVNDLFRVTFNYGHMNDVMRFIKDNHLTIMSTDFNLDCEVIFSIRKSSSAFIYGEFQKKDGIGIEYLKTQ